MLWSIGCLVIGAVIGSGITLIVMSSCVLARKADEQSERAMEKIHAELEADPVHIAIWKEKPCLVCGNASLGMFCSDKCNLAYKLKCKQAGLAELTMLDKERDEWRKKYES